MPKFYIDAGSKTFLPLCECGWRGLPAIDRADAWNQARHHEQRAHIGQIRALNAWVKAKRRNM